MAYTPPVSRRGRSGIFLPCLTIGALLLLPAGCATDVTPSYDDPTPAARLQAIRESQAQGRTQDIPRIVQNLAADDPTVRLAAIEALKRMTGTDLGYRASAPRQERDVAIARWKAWLHEQELIPLRSSGHVLPTT